MLTDDRLRHLAPDSYTYLPPFQEFATLDSALQATTHLLIVAHADDDGLIGAQALSETYGTPNKNMAVVVASASPGTGRPPGFEERTDSEMVEIRKQEQIAASDIGHYAATAQLGFSSAHIQAMAKQKEAEKAVHVMASLYAILDRPQKLDKLYLHSMFDEHDTHRALVMLCLETLRAMEPAKRPTEVYGVEVSSSLAWLPAQHRVHLPVTNMDLVKSVLGCYQTELAKRPYDRGLEGRAVANDTFQRDRGTSTHNPHICAIDYRPVIDSPLETGAAIRVFRREILNDFFALKMRDLELNGHEGPNLASTFRGLSVRDSLLGVLQPAHMPQVLRERSLD